MARQKLYVDELLRNRMKEAGMAAAMGCSIDNFFTFAGVYLRTINVIWERLEIVLLGAEGDDVIVTAKNELPLVKKESWIEDIRTYIEFRRSPIDLLAEVLREKGLDKSRVGIEKRFLMAHYYEELKNLLPFMEIIDSSDMLEEVRAVRLPHHIEIIGRVNRLTEETVWAAWGQTHPGDTEREVYWRMVAELGKRGAGAVRHCTLTAGDNSRLTHVPPSDKPLLPGEILRTDYGGLFDGYGSDIGRMGIVGDPSPEQAELYSIHREVQRKVISAIRPGICAADLYGESVQGYAQHGIQYDRPHIGHSISITGGHEEPMIHPNSRRIIEENMVFALEPIMLDSEGRRYSVEDVVWVRADGPQILTTATDTTNMFVIR